MNPKRMGLALALAALTLLGCDVRELPTVAEDSPALFSVSGADRVRDVPALRIELPSEPRPLDLDDQALASAVAEAGGVMLVGLKSPASVPVWSTREVTEVSGQTRAFGERAPLSREEALQALGALDAQGARVTYYANRSGIAVVEVDPELVPAIRALDVVDYAEPNSRLQLDVAGVAVRETFLSSSQSTDWGIQMIKAPVAWSVTQGTGAAILMIDTGHRQNHEDLPSVPTVNCGGAYGGCNDDANAEWHGSHVLGLFTARDNNVGYVGAAPGVAAADTYVWGACFHDLDLSDTVCDVDAVIAGINEGIEWEVDVINMSFGGVFPDTTTSAFISLSNQVAGAAAEDIVLVASAGNETTDDPRYPAAFSGVLGVSGVTDSGVFASQFGPLPSICGNEGSAFGSHVDLAAPFWGWSTVGPGSSAYSEMCGTSMSAPHVAGVAALMRARFPGMSADSIRTRLKNTAHHPDGQPDQFLGHGIVDADRALGVLHAVIDGPNHLTEAGWHQWAVDAWGGEAAYTYQWQVRWDDFGPTWYNLGSGSTQQLYVDETDGDFTLRVTVTSDDQQTTPQKFVVNGIGCDPEIFC